MALIMNLLKDGGRAGVVLPDGFMFGDGVKNTIKEKLLKEYGLHTIIRLPQVFKPYASVNTNLLFFKKVLSVVAYGSIVLTIRKALRASPRLSRCRTSILIPFVNGGRTKKPL